MVGDGILEMEQIRNRLIWNIEISLYDDDVISPQKLFDAIDEWIYDKYPDFSGLIGMRSEMDEPEPLA